MLSLECFLGCRYMFSVDFRFIRYAWVDFKGVRVWWSFMAEGYCLGMIRVVF